MQMEKMLQKKKCLSLKTFAVAILMALFAMPAMAQVNTGDNYQVYMKEGNSQVKSGATNVRFYDDHGPSYASDGYINYWDRWYDNDKHYTYVFRPKTAGDKIKVTFKKFRAYEWSDTEPNNCHYIGEFSLRINDDVLKVYNSDGAVAANLIAELTGTFTDEFTFMADGPMTFEFESNGQYREEGWEAEVTAVESLSVQAPIISRATCSNDIIITSTVPGATVYYTMGSGLAPTNPTPATGTLYTAPFEWPVGYGLTVKAIAVLDGVSSSVTTKIFVDPGDRLPDITLLVPTIQAVEGSNTVRITCPAVPSGMNETFYVAYTLDDTEPSYNNGQKVFFVTNSSYTYPASEGITVNYTNTYDFDVTTPGTTVRAKTFAYSCSDLISNEAAPVTIHSVYVDAPSISFTTTNTTTGAGTCTIGDIMTGATVYYTTDGSTPTTSSTPYTGPFAVTPGQTIKVIAHISGEGYLDSPVVSDTYIPTGEGGSSTGGGVYGSVVVLDDREPHTWSYYTNDSPIHSLNPRDIKITYYGNSPAGRTTMTNASENGNTPTSFSATATGVKVGVGSTENQDQFIYLKTLEAANADGSGNYPYTAIPNPFQVRPTGQSGSVTPDTRTVYISWSCDTWYYTQSAQVYFIYTNGSGTQVTSSTYTSNGNTTITAKVGTTITLYARGSRNRTSSTYNPTVTAKYDDNNGSTIVSCQSSGTSYTNNSGSITATTITVPGWRGFYAWRIKSLSDGLTISGKSVGDIVNAEEEIQFITSKEEGNEVEFEALWAQAYVTTGSTSMTTYVPATVTNAYERNFHVVTGNNQTASNYQKSYPVTISSLYPDGTSGGGSLAAGDFTASADTKFENISLGNGTSNNYTANYHDLIFGRGVTGTVYTVRGSNTGTIDSAVDMTMRLEQGNFTRLWLTRGRGTNSGQATTFSSTVSVRGVLGCDYDRAKGDNDKLSIAPNSYIEGGSGSNVFSAQANRNNITYDWILKSGKIQSTASVNTGDPFYMGNYISNENTMQYKGKRRLIIEGGEIGTIAGGCDNYGTSGNTTYSTYAVNDGGWTVMIRMKGGTVNGSVYGAAVYIGSSGDRRFVFTGGTVKGWIAGGCNGTRTDGGDLFGDSYIYFGGNAKCDGSQTTQVGTSTSGNIMGAGSGNSEATGETATVGRVTNSTIVIADEATVARNVYGGGNYGYVRVGEGDKSDIYVLGGTVSGSVFGGSNQQQGQIVNMWMKGGTITGSLYGGSNSSGTVKGLATVNVSGGTVTNVFGGGYGSSTNMSAGTKVNVSGGTINNNVYGGSALGTVTAGNTEVNVSGGTMKDVFGAGQGGSTTALVSGQTTVKVTGGTMNNVYGGGEAGNVANGTNLASKVEIDGTGVTVNQNVFGGGMEGYTTGKVVVNLFHGNIRGHLFGGALGKQGSVYVGGQKTVNITGGHVFGHAYGGSRNANDANSLTGYSTTEQATTCEFNMSAGKIDQNLYGAGYFGHTYGSVNVYLGAEAISNAPNHTTIDENINYTREGGLNIEGSVYAGSDWGDFTGEFGAPTVSGMSNIYVDGTGYNTTSTNTGVANYMKAGITLLGCGTSCDAGNTGRTLIVRNYGTAVADAGNTANPFSNATRSLFSIQRFKEVIFDNSHILFTGQGKVNSLNVTEKYGLYEDWTVYLGNGSTMITNVPSSQIKSFQSVTCPDVYVASPEFTEVAINGLGATGSATDNKIRVNGGSYIEIKYEADGVTTPYGELKGWAHMMSSTNSQEATCAYARPKQSQEEGNRIPESENNGNDGGFVSYDGIYNQYTTAGALVATGNQDQIRYENHTPNMTKGDSQYFRIWRYGGNRSNMELVFDAHATGTEGYRTVDVTVTLPPFRSSEHYYCFETTGEAPNRNTKTEYGSDVLTFNMAAYNVTMDSDGVHGTPTETGYMYYQNGQQLNQTAAACPGKSDIDDNPDVNFGLVIMPDNTTAVQGSNYIICDASDNYLAELNKPFTCRDNTQAPSFTFRLTYSNELSSNMTWDPMLVKLVQCDKDGNITDYVTLELVVVTSTTIAQNFTTQVYAIMDGQGHMKDTYISKIILPTYNVQTAGENSTFTVKSVSFTADEYVNEQGAPITPPSGTNVTNNPISNNTFDRNSFGLAIEAGDTYDNTNVWFSTGDRIDVAVNPVGKEIGKESGRNEVGIDVILFYSGLMTVQNETHMGTINVEVEFDNYAEGDANHKGILHLIIEVYRLGAGDNFYVDGIDGKDETGHGKDPDKPAATVNYIFNRCGYRPGGNIFVVNTVTVDKPETWNGARFNSVKMYRYPGVHRLSTGEYGTPETNPAFTGKLVDVTNELTLRGIIMDGMYAEANLLIPDQTTHNQYIYPSDQGCSFNGQAFAPMINVAEGGRVNLKDGVVLQNNYNTTASVTETSNPGGALSVQFGGTARMNKNAQIMNNINAVGGGAWVDGSLIVSDTIMIFDNKIGTATTSRQSNVWLTEATEEQAKANVHYKVIQIGTSSTTDEYGPLVTEGEPKIGVDKEDWANTIDGFMPVVYAEDGTQLGTADDYLEDSYQANQADPGEGIIFHDGDKYKLEKYTDDHYLYWIGTWVQKQDHQPTDSEEDGGVAWDGIDNITTANQFAWIISLVNGENGCDPDDFAGKTIVVKNDLDLKASIWVPMTNFKGTLQGNGHVIQGLNSPLVKDNMGMFGDTDGATIQDVVAKVDFTSDAENIGSLIGTMKNTTLSNVEAAGDLEGKSHTKNMGGLVGLVESGTIHSSFAVNDMTANSGNTVMGGLVGTNKSDLYNSFANTTMSGPTGAYNKIGGLVGENNGHVENCYAVVGTQTFPAFANTNNGVITICYADNANGYVTNTGEGTGVELSKHGLYGAVQPNIKHVDYMYRDNLIAANTNTYVGGEGVTSYIDHHIPVWNGLLSALNQWVRGHQGYTSWNRPITTTINGDLPILAFPKDNCVGNLNTANEDGKMLRYSAYNLNPNTQAGETFNNGLDNLLGKFYKDKAANIFLYKSTKEVENGTGSNKLFIHEDAALIQKASRAMETINATVGVTFDNSDHGQTAYDLYGNKLLYDWHMMSTPLTEALIGAEYDMDAQLAFGTDVNIESLEGSYFPYGLITESNPAVGGDLKWDFYSYFEPQYHWINLKRSTGNHWHIDGSHEAILDSEDNPYQNEETFVPGKGYMMAISQDTYMNSTGVLNTGGETIEITNQEPLDPTYNKGWNLVGNPYQAYLDLEQVGNGPFYIYDAEQGVYAPYVKGQSQNPWTPSQYIHPHQGFFMYSTAASDQFAFSYDWATVSTDNGSYFRGVNYPLVNLVVENQRGNRDLTIIEFSRPELGGATKVMSMLNSNFQMAASLDGQNYGILFTPEGTERVPVRFKTEENGTFTLRWSTHNGDFTSLRLVDNITGVNYDMLANDHYTFEASTEDYASRFYITYTCTGVDEEVTYDSDNFAFFDGSSWVVNGKGQLDLVDMTGRVLFTEQLNNEQNRVNLNGFAQGVYLMRVIDNKVVRTQKIIVK